jgi:PIN domain nuclease of toxin-antitoxin system
MSYLLDTHYVLWSLIEPDRVDRRARAAMRNSDHVKHVSVVSFWEISLKYSLGKLQLKGTTPEELLQAAIGSGFALLPLEGDIVASSHHLPAVTDHRDPFDRLLIWQCIHSDLTMLSADHRFKEYEQHGLRLL